MRTRKHVHALTRTLLLQLLAGPGKDFPPLTLRCPSQQPPQLLPLLVQRPCQKESEQNRILVSQERPQSNSGGEGLYAVNVVKANIMIAKDTWS